MRAAFPPTRTPATARHGFTLVELLTVIIIIGLLTALLVAAIGRAMVSSKDARMVAEIAQLDSAVKQFHNKYGVYPPCYLKNSGAGNNDAVVRRTFRKMFPRMDPSSIAYLDLNPAEAFVFFLGGKPISGDSTKTPGFNLNPTSPMATGGQRSPPLFQFEQGRLVDLLKSDGTPGQNGYYEYYPKDSTQPYSYIDANHYGVFPGVGSATTGYAFPYKDASTSSSSASGATTGGYMNPQTFQIISAGQDSNFGASDVNKVFPTGANFAPEDGDNLTNFSTNRLEDSIQ
jgi:prepilin-type N-terminal cleavage/methylation domain-containing protein